MDFTQYVVRSGIGSDTQTWVDGKPETYFFKLRTPEEIAFIAGEMHATSDDGAGAVKRQVLLAGFLADSLCEEDGRPLVTAEVMRKVSPTLKQQIYQIIIAKSNESVASLGKT